MFDVHEFVEQCQIALTGPSPREQIRSLLERAVRDPQSVARALPIHRAEIAPLYTSETLSVLKVVWAPGMSFRPHNHLMWAAIGLYCGQEDNTFYARERDGLVARGGRSICAGEVASFGTEAIHSVKNPRLIFTGAIHVYGGDIARRAGRSEWEEPALKEVDYDFDRTRRYFEQANAACSD